MIICTRSARWPGRITVNKALAQDDLHAAVGCYGNMPCIDTRNEPVGCRPENRAEPPAGRCLRCPSATVHWLAGLFMNSARSPHPPISSGSL
jgi:hypothetical protein